MKDYFLKQRENIRSFLAVFLEKKKKELSTVNFWGEDSLDRLFDFSKNGKMIRGGLVLFSNEMFGNKNNSDTISLASALELFHSSLLIHDDIMDNDELRRGSKTIFAQYKELGSRENFKNSMDFGKSMGICVGDIGYFLGFEIINNLKIKSSVKKEIFDLCCKEFTKVGLSQMQDEYFGNSKKEVTEEEIMSVYLYKTARYTFSLPLAIGAILGGQKEKTVDELIKLGEFLGIIFQIKDDEMGIFGEEKITGKPIGSDIREGKKTLYYYHLFKNSSEKERKKLENIFGNKRMDKKMFNYVISEIERLKIKEIIDMKIGELEKKTRKIILNLEVDEKYRKYFFDILENSLSRKS